MCILRYTPSRDPSASMTAAELWYTPAPRFSKRETTITISQRLAKRWNASVVGPGIDSAKRKFP